MHDVTHDQPVRLILPASPRFLAAARLVAASLGAEAGLTVDDLDDLRLGVNEMVSLLVEATRAGGRIEREFEVDDSQIPVRGSIDGESDVVDVDDLPRRIVEAVADHHELDATSFSLTKGSTLRDDG